MGLKLVTAPANEPAALADVKLHLRVDGAADDAYIMALITAVRETVEDETRRALITQTWDLVMDRFPPGNEIKVPFPPLQSVTSIKYTDDSEVENTMPAADYIVDVDSLPGRIVLKSSARWPNASLRAAAGVRIQFVAGYGDAAADVPKKIIQAMYLMIGHYYEHREEVIPDQRLREVPLGAKRLLQSVKVYGF